LARSPVYSCLVAGGTERNAETEVMQNKRPERKIKKFLTVGKKEVRIKARRKAGSSKASDRIELDMIFEN
jgi:hypothetical protein